MECYITKNYWLIRNKYFGLSVENIFSTWWKARKYFKFPKVKWFCKFGEQVMLPYMNIDLEGNVLDIYIHDLMWKSKWDSPRHERNPLFRISLFRRFTFGFTLYNYSINEFGEHTDASMEYWEYLLEYVFFGKKIRVPGAWMSDSRLYQIVEYGDVVDKRKPMKLVSQTQLIALNKNGLKKLKENVSKAKENLAANKDN